MSAWLAKARERRTQLTCARPEACANCAKTSQSAAPDGSFGTNGTIGTACSIPFEEIRSRLGWITQRLMDEDGQDFETAKRDGLSILKAQLLNDPRLAQVQMDTRRCFVCGGDGRSDRVLVPVLTGRPDNLVWLHLEPCHGEYRKRRSGQVDELLHSAFYPTSISADRGEAPPREGRPSKSRAFTQWTGVIVEHATPQYSKEICAQPHG
jgi:hypothetical protein